SWGLAGRRYGWSPRRGLRGPRWSLHWGRTLQRLARHWALHPWRGGRRALPRREGGPVPGRPRPPPPGGGAAPGPPPAPARPRRPRGGRGRGGPGNGLEPQRRALRRGQGQLHRLTHHQPGDRAAAQEGPRPALALEHPPVWPPRDLGVLPGHRRIADHHIVVEAAPDPDGVARL